MGADLPPQKAKAPTFLVWAVKDPTSGNLDRIQIVKGWTKNGQSFEKIFDVVWAGNRKPDKWTGKLPSIGSTVDVDNATYTNSIGAVELKTVWTDPEFDPGLHAFYYARVLEIPTPRWTTIQAHQLGIAPPDVVPATIQERAWSSPIWYTPSAEARKNVPSGPHGGGRCARRAPSPLNDAQLKTLVVGKSDVVAQYASPASRSRFVTTPTEGASSCTSARESSRRAKWATLAESGYLVEPSPYAIKNGKLVDLDRQHAIRARRSTSWETPTTLRARTSSAMRTTRRCRRGRRTCSTSRRGNRKNRRFPDIRTDRMRRWLREPLVQFLVLGLLLFVVHGVLRRAPIQDPKRNRIALTVDDLRQLDVGFTAQWQRRPTRDEMIGLVENRIREDVLYREALALGLDKEDSIVKRRMAQKMEFLAEDASAAHEPTTAELQAWFEKNSAQFALPGSRHVSPPLLLARSSRRARA